MPDIIVKNVSRKFDRKSEQDAFKALMQMRKEGQIGISVWDVAVDALLENQNDDVQKKMLQYFSNRISKNTTDIVEGEQLAKYVERAQTILFSSGEKQDDMAVFVMTYVVRTEISHFTTMDAKYHSKWQGYLKKLMEDSDLTKFVEFRRRWNPYFVGFPTQVLDDIMKETDNK